MLLLMRRRVAYHSVIELRKKMSKERYRRAVKESRSLQWWDKTYTDNLRESYRSELKQESEYYMREVKELRSPDQEPIMKADLFSAPLLKASLARALRRGLEDRLRKREIINNCTVSIIVPDCYFFGVVWPVLERDVEAAVAQRHVGLWARPSTTTRRCSRCAARVSPWRSLATMSSSQSSGAR